MYISAILFQAKPGHSAAVRSGVLEVGSLLGKAGAANVATWNALAGAPYGAFAVSSRFDSVAAYLEAVGKMQSDSNFQKISKELGGNLQIPVETRLNQIIAASPNYVPQPFVATTNVVIAAGQLSSAMAWCTEFIEFADKVTGNGGVLTKGVGGRVGAVGFIFSADDASHWETLQAKLVADPGYVARMDQLDGMFEPGSDLQVLMTQIA